jgi:hypothetical protein
VHGALRQLHVPAIRHVRHQRLVERLFERRIRIEAAAAPRVSVVTRVERRQAAPRIEITMVRTQAPAAQAAAMAGAGIAAPGDARPGSSQPRFAPPAPPAPPLVLPAQELSRLTDHVIRQLDHRVLSWQERTGRI